MRMIRTLLQVIAFFFPMPVNIWLHRLAGASIGRHVVIHPGVMILARKVVIGPSVKIRLGTLINVRSFAIGEKSLMGYFVHAKGMSDLHAGPACVIGPQTMINCDCPVSLGYYCGVGPRVTMFTHGSFLPVTEGYRTTFGGITMKDKSWVTMNSTVGPGVTIGEGTNILPGTILLESVGQRRLVSGNPVKLLNIPQVHHPGQRDLRELGYTILNHYSEWCGDTERKQWVMNGGTLQTLHRKRIFTIAVDGEGDIALYSDRGKKRDGMYFNLADLITDGRRHRIKTRFEAFMRLYYGLTFLESTSVQFR
jgi:acetyltransferase-like isoleucine patch superfamily enzyme